MALEKTHQPWSISNVGTDRGVTQRNASRRHSSLVPTSRSLGLRIRNGLCLILIRCCTHRSRQTRVKIDYAFFFSLQLYKYFTVHIHTMFTSRPTLFILSTNRGLQNKNTGGDRASVLGGYFRLTAISRNSEVLKVLCENQCGRGRES